MGPELEEEVGADSTQTGIISAQALVKKEGGRGHSRIEE